MSAIFRPPTNKSLTRSAHLFQKQSKRSINTAATYPRRTLPVSPFRPAHSATPLLTPLRNVSTSWRPQSSVTKMTVITAFDVSIDLSLRGLRSLKAMLTKAYARPASATSAKSHQDLAFQVQCCVNLAVGGLGLLTRTQQEAPVWGGETTLAEMIARVDKAIELLANGAKPEDLTGIEDKSLEVTYGNGQIATWGGREYVLGYSIPNFMFHLCMAYSNLQSRGVDVGKMDYLMPFMAGMAPGP
ncbi:hypothetical protein GE09DRAFT_1146891 [Coniochaeta sp. 2T2.1]|nr:hypothetical protein GE09DRAFT_1146891 [Coniochaeta sp. 2T2.1]